MQKNLQVIVANMDLTFERSDRMITQFDYADYLWDGQRDDFMQSFETCRYTTA